MQHGSTTTEISTTNGHVTSGLATGVSTHVKKASSTRSSVVGLAVGLSLGLLCLIAMIIAVILYKRRKTKKSIVVPTTDNEELATRGSVAQQSVSRISLNESVRQVVNEVKVK